MIMSKIKSFYWEELTQEVSFEDSVRDSFENSIDFDLMVEEMRYA
jgi:hypothetical protein